MPSLYIFWPLTITCPVAGIKIVSVNKPSSWDTGFRHHHEHPDQNRSDNPAVFYLQRYLSNLIHYISKLVPSLLFVLVSKETGRFFDKKWSFVVSCRHKCIFKAFLRIRSRPSSKTISQSWHRHVIGVHLWEGTRSGKGEKFYRIVSSWVRYM